MSVVVFVSVKLCLLILLESLPRISNLVKSVDDLPSEPITTSPLKSIFIRINSLSSYAENILGRIVTCEKKVNKYGLVGIGDSRFNDASEDYHLSVSGDTCIKGELNFASNIDVLSTDTISRVSIKTNDVGELLIKDSTTQGYVKAIGGPLITPINTVTVSTNLTYTATTVLVNNNVNEDIILTVPDTGIERTGHIFNIKKISNTG